MTDGTPSGGLTRRFPTWQEFLAAKTGWPFLIKWVVVGAAPSPFFMAIIIRGKISSAGGAYWYPAQSTIAVVVAAVVAMQAWLLFGWSWRIFLWIGAAALTEWWGAGFGHPFRFGFALFYLPVIQCALLLGVRARAAWWLGAAAAGYVAFLLYRYAAHPLTTHVIAPWAESTTGLWKGYLFSGLSDGLLISQLIIQGAALAWLMPPVLSASNRASKP